MTNLINSFAKEYKKRIYSDDTSVKGGDRRF